MTTATRTRKPRTKPARTLHLYPGAPALLEMTIGADTFAYWLAPLPADFGAAFEVRKLLADGGDVYHVHLDDQGHHSCDCAGGSYCGHCKHLSAVLALVKCGKLTLPARKPVPAPEPLVCTFDDP